VVGLTTDLARADARDQATDETAWVLNPGQSAVIADVSDDSPLAIDSRMLELGGIVASSTRHDDSWFGEDVPSSYLYPYEYIPPGYAV